MLKRLFLIALFTGAGQLFAILILKLVAQKGLSAQLAGLAHVDSLFFFIMNVIAFGLQSVAIRNIALSKEWKTEYINTQSARLTLALLLTSGALLAFNDPVYIIFLLAPFIALSGDYALYSLGHPITGAIIAFVRAVIPYGLMALIIWGNPDNIVLAFIGGIAIAFAVTNFYISRFIGAPVIVMPKWKNLVLYIYSIPLGLVNVSLYFIGIGLLLIVPYFYPESTVAVVFVGLKFYFIYKGILRIIHQAFVKEMMNDDVCLQIDQLSIICGLAFAGTVLIFPEAFITVFFGKVFIQYANFFVILGIAALIYSFVLSMGTRMMLEKRDKKYTLLTIAAALTSIASVIIFSFYLKNAEAIALSILFAEIICMLGLLLMNTEKLMQKRFLFFFESALLLAQPLAFRYLFSDSPIWFLTGMGTFAMLLLFLNRRKFKTLGMAV
jgi:O-antigen/teichoic acid export membrane protein